MPETKLDCVIVMNGVNYVAYEKPKLIVNYNAYDSYAGDGLQGKLTLSGYR